MSVCFLLIDFLCSEDRTRAPRLRDLSRRRSSEDFHHSLTTSILCRMSTSRFPGQLSTASSGCGSSTTLLAMSQRPSLSHFRNGRNKKRRKKEKKKKKLKRHAYTVYPDAMLNSLHVEMQCWVYAAHLFRGRSPISTLLLILVSSPLVTGDILRLSMPLPIPAMLPPTTHIFSIPPHQSVEPQQSETHHSAPRTAAGSAHCPAPARDQIVDLRHLGLRLCREQKLHEEGRRDGKVVTGPCYPVSVTLADMYVETISWA